MKRWVARERDRSLISEMDARGVPGAQNDHCLICETDNCIRRIWHYPADWHRLEDAKLIALFDAPLDHGWAAYGARRSDGREYPSQE